VVFLIVDTKDSGNFVSLSGLFAFMVVCVLLSNNPTKINWHILIVGIEIQFILGVVLLKTEFGYQLFKFISEAVTTFLQYTNRGSQLVFGDKYTDHLFAFQSIPVIVFFSAVINLLYYLGFIQYLILKLAWFVNLLLGTSPTESMNATANIFLGQVNISNFIKNIL
jgi:pyrimidine nucleoside transport protein